MPLWGKTDAANNSPLTALAQVGVAANTTNQTALYGNTTADAFITGVTVGQFGVDTGEVQAAREGGVARPASPGWALRTVKGDRVMFESLVAFSSKGGFSTDGADDAVLPDFKLRIRTQPADASANVTAAETASFTISAYSVPAGATLAYDWQANTGSGFASVSDGAVYSGQSTATLTVSDVTGLDGAEYRVVVQATGAANVTSSTATLTVTT